MDSKTITACATCGDTACKQPKSVACRYARMIRLLRREDFKRTFLYYCHDLFYFSDPCYTPVETLFISAILEYRNHCTTAPCPNATEQGVGDLYRDIPVALTEKDGWIQLYKEKKLGFSEVRCGLAQERITANELGVFHTNTTPAELVAMVAQSWKPIEFRPRLCTNIEEERKRISLSEKK